MEKVKNEQVWLDRLWIYSSCICMIPTSYIAKCTSNPLSSLILIIIPISAFSLKIKGDFWFFYLF